MGEPPAPGTDHETHALSDKDNIYAYEKHLEAQQIYIQRTADIVVVDTGLEVGVPTHIMMPPLVYGRGSSLFKNYSYNIPRLIQESIKAGQAQVIGDGEGVWDYVHIADLANLYELLLSRILSGEYVPSGEEGIFFAGTGRSTWKDASVGVAKALVSLGVIKSEELKYLSYEEASEIYGMPEQFIKLGFASR